MDRFAITAEGPSCELAIGFLGAVCERPAGWTYPAAHEPKVFMREDEARNYLASAMAEAIASMPAVLRTFEASLGEAVPTETEQLREQLETARKKLAVVDYYSRWLPTKALAEIADIDAGQKDGERFDRKCPHCDFVTEYPLMFENHVKYGHGAGQEGGK